MGAIQFWEVMLYGGSTQQPPLYSMVLNRLGRSGLDRVVLTGCLHICGQLMDGYLEQLHSQAPVKQGFWLLTLMPSKGDRAQRLDKSPSVSHLLLSLWPKQAT